MNEDWEFKYKALAAGIKDPQIVENAERMVEVAARISSSSHIPFHGIMAGMIDAAVSLENLEIQKYGGNAPCDLGGR